MLRGGRKFLEYTESKYGESISTWETNLYIVLQGIAAGLLPFIAFASTFKTGNKFVKLNGKDRFNRTARM